MAGRDFPLSPTPEPNQNQKPTPDSTGYYRNKVKDLSSKILNQIPNLQSFDPKEGQKIKNLFSEKDKSIANQLRQSKKGKPGYDKNGFPIKKP